MRAPSTRIARGIERPAADRWHGERNERAFMQMHRAALGTIMVASAVALFACAAGDRLQWQRDPESAPAVDHGTSSGGERVAAAKVGARASEIASPTPDLGGEAAPTQIDGGVEDVGLIDANVDVGTPFPDEGTDAP